MPIVSSEESKSVRKRKQIGLVFEFLFDLMDNSLFELLCSVWEEKYGNHWILSLIHSLGCVFWLSKKYVLNFERDDESSIGTNFPKGIWDGTCHHLFGLLFRFGYDIRCLECFQPVWIYSASSFGTTIMLGIVHVRGVSSIHSLHMNHLLHHLE